MWKMRSIFREIRVPMFFFDTQVGMYVHYLLVRKYIQMLAEANVENMGVAGLNTSDENDGENTPCDRLSEFLKKIHPL